MLSLFRFQLIHIHNAYINIETYVIGVLRWMVFDGSGKFRPGIEEACDSGVVFCEDLDDCLLNEDR